MNTIEFQCSEELESALDDIKPIPAKLNIPEWYKKLNHAPDRFTVKGCMPFLDTLTTGYILKTSQDLFLKHNHVNEKNERDTSYRYALHDESNYIYEHLINLNHAQPEIHPIYQVGEECPYAAKNKNLPFYKILNPYIIKTPPGYSTLFVPPLNNSDDRFSIIPGIVDTDKFNKPINFPIVINGDKYPKLETTIKRGTPYVQVIPFKRESWKMKLTSSSYKDRKKNYLYLKLKLIHNYKDLLWSKKTWK